MTSPAPFSFFAGVSLEEPTQGGTENLAALREVVADAPVAALLHHVVRIGARFPRAKELPPNDFARWAGEQLQDPGAAERLAYAGFGPTASFEELRSRLLAAFGPSPSKREVKDEDARFRLVVTRTVKVPLEVEVAGTEELLSFWPTLGLDTTWYHVVVRRR